MKCKNRELNNLTNEELSISPIFFADFSKELIRDWEPNRGKNHTYLPREKCNR